MEYKPVRETFHQWTDASGTHGLSFSSPDLAAATLDRMTEIIGSIGGASQDKRMKRLTTIFQQADKDGNGSLDSRELRHVVAKCFKKRDIEFDSTVLKKYTELQISTVDENQDGTVDFDEFVVLYNRLMEDPELPIQMKAAAETADLHADDDEDTQQDYTPQPLNYVKDGHDLSPEEFENAMKLFAEHDTDHSGKIDRNELTVLIKQHMGNHVSDSIIQRFVNANIDLGDEDGDGLIDSEEFLLIFKRLYAEKKNWLGGHN